MNPLDVLAARGFVQQCTGEDAVREALAWVRRTSPAADSAQPNSDPND